MNPKPYKPETISPTAFEALSAIRAKIPAKKQLEDASISLI